MRRAEEVRDRRLAYALDASALLALLQGEAGGDMVGEVLEHAIISSVNWSEVVQKAAAREVDVEGLRADVEALGLVVLPFSAEEAEEAAALWPRTRHAGLSLGDRACLALARRVGLTALTTDHAWGRLDLPVEVYVLR